MKVSTPELVEFVMLRIPGIILTNTSNNQIYWNNVAVAQYLVKHYDLNYLRIYHSRKVLRVLLQSRKFHIDINDIYNMRLDYRMLAYLKQEGCPKPPKRYSNRSNTIKYLCTNRYIDLLWGGE
jgi:hypothetical protein